ncbi:MAG: HD domain-containing phosphohydrolase [Thermoguttaceae bacterium]
MTSTDVGSSLKSAPVVRRAEAAAKIMIVDDEPINIKAVTKYLKDAGFSHLAATSDPRQIVTILQQENPDVLLLDIMMPGVNGLDILQTVRASAQFARIPVLILTAIDDRKVKAAALDLGATDFLTKPVDPIDLVPRVRNVVAIKAYQDYLCEHADELERQVQLRTAELETSRMEVIHCLGRAAEYRDNDTGMHVVRVGRYAGIIARQLGLEPAMIELIEHAAPLHDVGKIGVPDAVLLKRGKLTEDEFELIRQHCEFGKRIVGEGHADDSRAVAGHTTMGATIMNAGRSPTLQMATRIAMTHHEKWDGSGYPRGLSGQQIPLEGRITAVADVFDALSHDRPYKSAFPLEQCFTMMERERGKHFDPQVLDAFFARRKEILRVRLECHETAPELPPFDLPLLPTMTPVP